MGDEIERDTINFQAEADERGLMGAKTSVKERFEAAEDESEKWLTDEISDLGDYEHDFDPGAAEQGSCSGGTAVVITAEPSRRRFQLMPFSEYVFSLSSISDFSK